MAKQIVVLSVGCMDAMMLSGWEARREEAMQSRKWMERQERKVDGAMRAFDGYVEAAEREGRGFVVGVEISIADIAIVCAVGAVEWGEVRPGWRDRYPVLARYFDRLDGLDEFKETRPVMFDLTEQVV